MELRVESTRLLSSGADERRPGLSAGMTTATVRDIDHALKLPDGQPLETGRLCDPPMGLSASQVLEAEKAISPADTSPREAVGLVDRHNIVDTDLSTFFSGTMVLFSLHTGVPMPKPTKASTKCPLVLMEAKIQGAMHEFNIQSFHQTLEIRPFVSDLNSSQIQKLNNEILTKIVQLAMQAMLHGTRIGGYSHVLVSCKES